MVRIEGYALITGASRGIGAAVARGFAESECALDLALVARNRDGLEDVAAQCRTLGADSDVYPCDLTDENSVDRMCRHILDKKGAPAVLINNAGSFESGGLRDTNSETFLRQVGVNLTSAFNISSRLVPPMMDAAKGHVFFVGSVASIRGYPGGLAYCAAKHGLLGLARSIREETKESGVRVTTLIPGATLTATWDGVSEPDNRFMSAEDIARAVLSAYSMSDRTVVEEIILRPQLGDL